MKFLLSASILVHLLYSYKCYETNCPSNEIVNQCANRASKGECLSGRIESRTIRKKLCACSCDRYFYDRIQTCCTSLNVSSRCMPLCRYNTTKHEMIGIDGMHCLSGLSTWLYCGWDGNDGSRCCAQRGVPIHCQLFCNAQNIACNLSSSQTSNGQIIGSLFKCIRYKSIIADCQLRTLQVQSKFNSNWKPNSQTCE